MCVNTYRFVERGNDFRIVSLFSEGEGRSVFICAYVAGLIFALNEIGPTGQGDEQH